MRYNILMKEIRIQSRVFITNNAGDKILLLRNKGKDFWYLPGGGLEDNETIIECAEREVFEEVGVKIEIEKMLYTQELHDDERQYFEFFFASKPIAEESVDTAHLDTDADSEIDEMCWFAKGDLSNITVFPAEVRGDFWRERDLRDNIFLGVLR